MLILTGRSAATEFRSSKRLQQLQSSHPKITALHARWIYFLDVADDLTTQQRAQVKALLQADTLFDLNDNLHEKVIITPRIGTISPWASKATDILQVCGLANVSRVEHGVLYEVSGLADCSEEQQQAVIAQLYDRMVEVPHTHMHSLQALFSHAQPKPVEHIGELSSLPADIKSANTRLGLALSADEIEYLANAYQGLNRLPTDVELMMFAQANSEHCRHKIFNGSWTIDGEAQPKSLFGMIRNTYENNADRVLSAYSDNAAVIQGSNGKRFYADTNNRVYQAHSEAIDFLIKVETHNHPTAISPFPGAATGSGGEIRDEGATGRGGYPKAGLCGFSVSNLKIPGFELPWEEDIGKPERIVSALDIMIEGPIGAASFNNEFGRPNLCGYFRSFEQAIPEQGVRGYHKPIMIAGGMGNIKRNHVAKQSFPEGTPIIVLGGPAMLIGLGGGAASSMASGSSAADLDYASVQRGNPEMQRRCQEVINQCWAMGDHNPIRSIHDVGAGGLSNAVPEILHDCKRGGNLQLRAINNDEPGMSPMEIWCNEAQERYVLAINADALKKFEAICKRERCPYAVIGEATEAEHLSLDDSHFQEKPVDLPMEVLFGKPPKLSKDVHSSAAIQQRFDTRSIDISDAIERLLQLPTIASKSFLITIGDRTITGLVARDQMVGPWQVPVADVAVTHADYEGYNGEAMAMGERTPLAVCSAAASARMAVAEAITNILAADIPSLSHMKCSANWMAAAGSNAEDLALFEAVKAVGEAFCPALDITIPVGKDSLSMRTLWTDENNQQKQVTAPLSLIVSAFAEVNDVRKTLTPQLQLDDEETLLLLLECNEEHRLGGSCLAQVYSEFDDCCPDADKVHQFSLFVGFILTLKREGKILAYHDRSDGGVFITVLEMAFASGCGLELSFIASSNAADCLFNEEIGAVLQVRKTDWPQIQQLAAQMRLTEFLQPIGKPNIDPNVLIRVNEEEVYRAPTAKLKTLWCNTSYHIQRLRDHSECADSEYQLQQEIDKPWLYSRLNFDPQQAPAINTGVKPRVAILREQGVNGQIEMAAAFTKAGFEAVDVHMTDLLTGEMQLDGFQGLAACGGFSYGDVLGAGSGWAGNIKYNNKLKDIFEAYFHNKNVFALGVCNGCQMMSQLHDFIPGAAHWPRFERNRSEQFEARLVMVEVLESRSILFAGLAGSKLPIAIAHGEGRVQGGVNEISQWIEQGLAPLRYVDTEGDATERYPLNPNGSSGGVTALTNNDGRITIMMPHPERVFRTSQFSWHPPEWGENGPWLRLFENARHWLS